MQDVNDVPVITGQRTVSTLEDQPIAIIPAHLLVSDPDNTWPSDFTIQASPGENYTVSGLTVTPALNFSGTLSIPVTVNDGEHTSAPFALQITVTPVNDAPVIAGQVTLTTSEESPLSVSVSSLSIDDPDNVYPSDFALMLGPGSSYMLEGNTVIPAKDFSGMLSVPARVSDGIDDSAPFDLQISVTDVNDAPVITGQVALSTPENQGIAIDLSHLIISDPDNSSFTLSILAGAGYTVAGNFVTPSSGFNGDLTVKVFVSDGIANSNEFPMVISVIPVNDPPTIVGQRTISTAEEMPITLSLADVTATDPDNTFPEGFSFTVLPGDHYTFSGNLVTPSPDFTGSLYVNVIVSDGLANSEPYALLVTVTPVNDAPVITGQSAVSTNEETAVVIGLDNLVVDDPDNAYPAGFSLIVFAGDNYAVDGTTLLPATDFSGVLDVTVQVSDGQLTSNVFHLRVDVLAVNDKPVITGQLPVQTDEDTPVTILLSHLTVLDPDNPYPAGFSLSIAPGQNYTATGATILPGLNFNGTLNVPVTVSDGVSSSDPFIFQVQVGNANDAPVITGQSALSTNEETAVTLTLAHLAVTDPDNPYPTGFSLLVSPGANYTVEGATITPSLNFAGVLTVPVRVNDGINNSATFDFQLQVNQINDPPSFAAIANQEIMENATAGSAKITEISKGPMEDYQQLTFVATSGNTAVIEDPVVQYDGTGSTAILSYVLKPHASGIVTLTVVAIDNGGNAPPHQNSYSSTFQVTVVDINDRPTLDEISAVTIMEDAEQQNITLTGISAGPGESQTLSLNVTTDKPQFFDLLELDYASPATTGLIRFKTKANVAGTAVMSITVTDNGNGVAPHANTLTRKFSVIIQPVNDPPAFTSQPVTLAVPGEPYEYRITATDPDGDKLAFSAVVKPPWVSLATDKNGSARLYGKPPAGTLGNVEISLQARDATTYAEQKFNIYVNARPELADLSAATEEDTPFVFPANFFAAGYSDRNNNPIQTILIATLPTSGVLSLADVAVKAGDTIPASSISLLTYVPQENVYGSDSFRWNASDGYHTSASPSRVNVSVIPVNDPPRVVFQNDTLYYEVDGETALLAPVLGIEDPDDDTLSRASVAFHTSTYRPQMDVLEFQSTSKIRGQFDVQSGVLSLTGSATLEEYREALRSVRYVYLNTIDPILEQKRVTFLLSDQRSEGEGRDKVIVLKYTFVEFEIPTAFTPNGDQANDTWVIDRPGGGLEEMNDAVVSVYDKHGVLVHRSKGFEHPWDGTMNGELLPAGTYFFTIDLQLRNKKTYRGIVTILR